MELHKALSDRELFCKITRDAQNYSETKGARQYFKEGKYGFVRNKLKFNNDHHVSSSCCVSILEPNGELTLWASGDWHKWVGDDLKKVVSDILYDIEGIIERKQEEDRQEEIREQQEKLRLWKERRDKAVASVFNSLNKTKEG